MAEDGRIPPWEYLGGSRFPVQDEDKLDASDRAHLTKRRKPDACEVTAQQAEQNTA
jgi:hypothetical protein